MNLDQLPINLFDLVLIIVLIVGLAQGRKHGMSEELMSLLNWLAILFGCAALYEPAGLFVGGFTSMFGRLSCFLLAYVGVAVGLLLVFALIKRALGGKLLGSDIFGQAEYYLGMGAGLVRFSCILLAGLALLNARYFNPLEVRAMEKFQDDVYGSNFFPTLHSLQATVFDKSLTGPWINPAAPDKRKLHHRAAVMPGGLPGRRPPAGASPLPFPPAPPRQPRSAGS